MAVLVTAEVPGGTAQEAADWSARVGAALKRSPGFIVHVDHATAGGWQLISVWDSEEDFARYFRTAVEPQLPPGAPGPSITELAHVLQP